MLRVSTSRLFSQNARMAAGLARRGPAAALLLSATAPSAHMSVARRYSASFTTDADRADLNQRAQTAARKNGGVAEDFGRTRDTGAAGPSATEAEADSGEYQTDGGRMEKDADGNMRYYNPWEVLGLKPGASAHDIRLRYHELLQECHPEYVKGGKEADIIKLNQINKAYEIITKSPTLDKRYRNLVSDTQRMYYKLLPEWIAKNVDEQPRYISWIRWRVPSPLQIVFLMIGLYATGRFYKEFPVFTIVFFSCVTFDYLFHTMSAPFALSMLFLSAVVSNQTYTMSWLVSPRSMLQGGLGY